MINFNKKLIRDTPMLPLYIGVSMGQDSLAAAHFLRVYYKNRSVVLVHINNRLIKQDNYTEIKFRQFAEDFGYQHRIFVDDRVYTNGSKEAWCRQGRMQFFGEISGQIVLAHHINDAVESYLMHCFNGKPEYLPIPLSTHISSTTELIRPFLLTSRKSIEAYVNHNNLRRYVVEDELNNDLKLRRNWIRKRVIPVLEEQYKGLEKVVRKRYMNHGK